MKSSDTDRKGGRSISEGICLRRLDYGNTSQVVSFLTPGAGRIDCMARGAWRAPKKGVAAGIDLLAKYRLHYKTSRHGSLDTLLDFSMIEHFGGLRLSAGRAICGYYGVELMRNFTAHEQDCGQLYGVFLDKLRQFAAGERLGTGVLELEIAALRHYGSCPDFSCCAECRGSWEKVAPSHFCARRGGVLCRHCGEPRGGKMMPDVYPAHKVSAVTLLCHLCRETGGAGVAAEPDAAVAAGKILRYHISRLLGKELRMWKYLHGRHYTRSLARMRPGSPGVVPN